MFSCWSIIDLSVTNIRISIWGRTIASVCSLMAQRPSGPSQRWYFWLDWNLVQSSYARSSMSKSDSHLIPGPDRWPSLEVQGYRNDPSSIFDHVAYSPTYLYYDWFVITSNNVVKSLLQYCKCNHHHTYSKNINLLVVNSLLEFSL